MRSRQRCNPKGQSKILDVLHAETREATIADIRMVLDNIDDSELEEVCRHTLDKLMQISDEEYAALDLEVDEGFAYEE